MAPHLLTTGPAPAIPSGAWLRLSAAFTTQVGELAGRDDLTVTCTPGAGRGAPGCFIPALATVELDGTHLGHPPATCDPRRPSDRERYPALWGVFVHEAAHARHSIWTTPTSAPTTDAQAAHEAAIALEESRIEAAHLRRRPADRRWLRAAARQLILADFTNPAPTGTSTGTGAVSADSAATGSLLGTAAAGGPGSDTAAGPGGLSQVRMTPWEAGRAAALLLARVDAGVLDEDEVTELNAAITAVLGTSRLSALAALWHIAHATADHDHATMLELGRRWCLILGANPDGATPLPEQHEEEESEGESSRPSPLAAAITATLAAVATADAPPAPAAPGKAEERVKEIAARRIAAQAAHRVFTTPGANGRHANAAGGQETALRGNRAPTQLERAAARRVARHLKTAAHRERVTTVTTSPTPPGRLRMRGALAADAQRAAGATPTAEPFTRTTRRHVPSPPLRVGIACDVSGSMHRFAKPVASAAWILARAVSHLPDARSATVIFGEHVLPITHPGRAPARVREFAAWDGFERFCDAVDALDGALDLTRPGAARLLVIVSDGFFTYPELTGGQDRITRLTGHGCGVLWIAPRHDADIMNGAHRLTLTDPADAATAIGQAAARALATT